MNIRNKLFLRDLTISCFLFVILCIGRYFSSMDHLPFHSLALSAYSSSFFRLVVIIGLLVYILLWLITVKTSILNKQLRKCLEFISYIMIFWFLCRCIKYSFVGPNNIFNRYLWYLYYFALLFIPLYGLIASLYIGHDEQWKISNNINILNIITVILFVSVMTNEYHHLVFQFTPQQFLLDGSYEYGPLYYVIAIWMFLLTAFMISIIYYKCRTLLSRKRIWMPLSIIALLVIYTVFYVYFNIMFNEVTIVFIWVYILFWKSLIYSGLIPSNFLHTSIFDISDTSTMILDENHQVKYLSKNTVSLQDQVLNKLSQNDYQLDKETIIKKVPINGGSVVWLEDISSMNGEISKLKEIQKQIEENNDLLKAEAELKEKEEKVHTQNDLYNLIVVELKDYINQLDTLLQKEDPDLLLICLIGSYIKRRSNLIILEQSNSYISSKELDYCIKEILDVLKTKDILCTFINEYPNTISIDTLKELYDAFIKIVLLAYPSITSMIVKLIDYDCIKISIETDINLIDQLNESYDIKQEKSVYYITYKGVYHHE